MLGFSGLYSSFQECWKRLETPLTRLKTLVWKVSHPVSHLGPLSLRSQVTTDSKVQCSRSVLRPQLKQSNDSATFIELVADITVQGKKQTKQSSKDCMEI